MSRKTGGTVVFVAAFGMMAGLIGAELMKFQSFADALTPVFVGQSLIHVGTVVGAYVAGQLVPTHQALKSKEPQP